MIRFQPLNTCKGLQNLNFHGILLTEFGVCDLKFINNESFTPVQYKNEDYFMTKKLVKTLLVALCVVFMASNTAFASQSPQENAKKLIVQTAQKLGVDPHIALSIAKIESNFNASAKSPRGAIGLFQLTPLTAKKLGVNLTLLLSIFDPLLNFIVQSISTI